MVKEKVKQNIFIVWSNKIDFQKRGDTSFWSPKMLILERHKSSVQLNKVSQIKGGKRLPLGEDFSNGDGVPYIRTIDFTKGYIDYANLKRISDKVFNAIKNYQIFKEEVLISIVGTIGAVAILDKDFKKCNFTENAAKIVCSEKLNPYYLYAFLTSKIGQQQLSRLIVGGVQPKLPLYAIEEIQILLPDIKTQEKVEKIIKYSFQLGYKAKQDYQKAVEILSEELNKCYDNKGVENIFTKWNNEISIVEKLHPLSYNRPIMKKGVKKIRISDYSEDLDYGTSEKLNYQSFGVPFLRVTDIDNNYQVDFNNLKYISDFEAERQNSCNVELNDILISRTGTLGSAIVIDNNLEGSIFGSYFIKLRLKKEIKKNVLLDYLVFFINSEIGKQQSLALGSGGIQTNLTIQAIKDMEIPVIDIKKQKEIVALVKSFKQKDSRSKTLLDEAKRFIEELIEK